MPIRNFGGRNISESIKCKIHDTNYLLILGLVEDYSGLQSGGS
jgi:hypothetical protein